MLLKTSELPRRNFVAYLCVYDLQTRRDHLHQKYQVDRNDVNLQVIVHIVAVDLFARVQVKLGMERMLARLPLFE